MTFDTTIHLSDLLVLSGVLLTGWRVMIRIVNEVGDLKKTVYGSLEPPVEGLVSSRKRIDAELRAHGQLFSKILPR